MHTEFTLKIEFHAPTKESITTFVMAVKAAAKELSMQAALLSGDTPTVTFTIENNQIGVKNIKVFNGENNG